MTLRPIFVAAALFLLVLLSGCTSENAAQTASSPETSYTPASQPGPDAGVQQAKTIHDTIQQQLETFNRKTGAEDLPGEKQEAAKAILANCARLDSSASALLGSDRLAQTSGAQRDDLEEYRKFARETRDQILQSYPELRQ